MPVDGRKVKGTIHWVSAEHAIDADLYLYDNLFTLENVNDVPEGTDYLDYLNPDSLKKLTGCKLEPSLADAKEGERFQFVRMGYYCKDRETGRFNRIVTSRTASQRRSASKNQNSRRSMPKSTERRFYAVSAVCKEPPRPQPRGSFVI